MVNRKRVRVEGMNCTGCEKSVENALEVNNSIQSANADHSNGIVEIVVRGDVSDSEIEDIIYEAGFDFEGIVK